MTENKWDNVSENVDIGQKKASWRYKFCGKFSVCVTSNSYVAHPRRMLCGRIRETGNRAGVVDRERQSEAGPSKEDAYRTICPGWLIARTMRLATPPMEYLVSAFGLRPARDWRPGNIVYIHRPAVGKGSPIADQCLLSRYLVPRGTGRCAGCRC